MVCPKCKDEGKTSKVFDEGAMTTLMYCEPYYDENGIYHNHDYNTVTYYYRCSNGHHIREKGHKKCPNCDFGKNREGVEVLES